MSLSEKGEMEDLEVKYKNNELTLEDLSALKEQVNSSSDEQLETSMFQHWMDNDIDTSAVGDKRILALKEKIDAKIAKPRTSISLWRKLLRAAAAILLPVFILSTFYLYRENNMLSSDEMLVSTGKEEHASITLPDGTQVYLNSESKLRYIPKVYNKEERRIRFEGEGLFKVSKDKERPFVIDALGLQVQVLGTKFNLSVRKTNTTAELALLEGSVSFTSTKTGKNVILSPNQKAILDQQTGNITVEDVTYMEDITSWTRQELKFRNVPLCSVLTSIEKNYNVKIDLRCKNCMYDLFTGTLPSTNIQEALVVLESSYHFKAVMKNRLVIISSASTN